MMMRKGWTGLGWIALHDDIFATVCKGRMSAECTISTLSELCHPFAIVILVAIGFPLKVLQWHALFH